MKDCAICLVSFRPNKIYSVFFEKFINYDIYVIIDDNDYNENHFKNNYPNINFIKIKNDDCSSNGFRNLSYITLRKEVTGWEKALYYFSHIKQNYKYIWFMEDDVYFYNENTLLNIDNKYKNIDLLCNSSFEEAKLNEWLWNMIKINYSPPYYCGMMCIVRFSNKMIQSIKEYAAKNNTLFFLEACYPTIAIKNKLSYIKNPQEFLSVTHRDNHNIDLLNKHNLYHPIKNLNEHIEARNKNS